MGSSALDETKGKKRGGKRSSNLRKLKPVFGYLLGVVLFPDKFVE